MDDLDPNIERAFRKLMDASDKLAGVRIKSERERSGDWDMRRDVDDAMMNDLAGSPDASSDLIRYAKRVAAGICEWRDIEQLANPLPPEICSIKDSPLFRWYPARPTRADPADDPEDDRPYRIPWE